MTTVIPRQAVPKLSAPLLNGETWSLENEKPENFTLIVFYRGIFCPICHKYLRDLERHLSEFTELGVNVIVLSSDTKEGAQKAQEEWNIPNLRIGYGVDLETARNWGLFISEGRPHEVEKFSEPGVFLVRADGTLYFSAIQTMPFARPSFKEMVQATKYVLENDYPARGEVLPS